MWRYGLVHILRNVYRCCHTCMHLTFKPGNKNTIKPKIQSCCRNKYLAVISLLLLFKPRRMSFSWLGKRSVSNYSNPDFIQLNSYLVLWRRTKKCRQRLGPCKLFTNNIFLRDQCDDGSGNRREWNIGYICMYTHIEENVYFKHSKLCIYVQRFTSWRCTHENYICTCNKIN